MIRKDELSQIIKKVSKDWLYDEKDFVCYWDVNSGSCGEFALSVKEHLPNESEVTLVSTKDFLEEKGLESYGENGEFHNHVWLVLNGEHYDIERPNGVKDFLKLPFFQREIKMMETGINEDELFRLLNENPKKYEDLIAELEH